ncbi:hypothetical protein RSOLAG22IIIB_01373 [Rhizoctonia solani]|uniref:Uncharacterized protein n=1 Tax=Rhizoctonia solani TaxID=456999 RepID=A0A0K6G654_9AGAM|nr:hypothetical protein RSOLAG22IIIB_01373 [Rhizoctonia solani]
MLSDRRPPTANSRISAFLESQRGLISYYAAEGKSVAATWPKQPSGDSCPASPMLVPRTAAAKDNGFSTIAHSATPEPAFPADKQEYSIPESQKHRPAQLKSTRVVPVQLKTSRRKSIGRDQCSDDEPDRLQRLEQRRNRRRTRRYAMGVAEGATNREDEASEMDREGEGQGHPCIVIDAEFLIAKFGEIAFDDTAKSDCWRIQQGQELWENHEDWTAGRLVPDIVFSESRFLNKTASARNDGGDIEVDSDCSDDHSAHSLEERARQQKNWATKSGQRSSNKAVLDQVSRSGSPTPSSRSIREESPPWNIEETISSSPSSAKSAVRSPDNGHSTSPSVQKDVTISTGRSVWASRLRNPGPHTPAIPDSANSASGSHLPRAPPAQNRTVSAYFALKTTPEEPQHSAAPSIELDRLEENQLGHRVDSFHIATPDPVDPPSTPECLQLEYARLLPAPENPYIRGPEVLSPLTEAVTTGPLSPAINPQDDGIQEWNYEIEPEPEPERGVQTHFTVGRTKRMDWASEHVWNDSDIPGWEEYPRSQNIFPTEEAQLYKIHSDLDYDIPFEGVECSDGEARYLYEGSECVYENGEYLENVGAYTLRQGDGNLEYDDLEGETLFEELDDYNPQMEVVQDQEYHQPTEWPIDDTIDFNPDQTNAELDQMTVQDEPMETDDEWTEDAPRLIRVITEASLQDDLIKSMSGHWSAAHKLY